jgi:hypothetical protein
MIAFTRGVKGPVVNEEAIAFLFSASPNVGVTEGGTGASEAPKMDAEAFASYILEQFKARVATSSRKPWEEAKEYFYQLRDTLWHPWRYRDADFIRMLSETVTYPDKLDFDMLMNMWLSLPRRERKKARTLIAYKIAEYGAEEFLKLIAQSEKVQTDAELRRTLLEVAQAFVNKNIGVFNLTRALEDMFFFMSLVQIEEDEEKNITSFVDGLFMIEQSRKDRLRELVKRYIIDELTAIEKKLEEEAEEEEEYFYWDEDPYSVPCGDYCEDDEEYCYENFDEECSSPVEDYYDYDDP